MPKVPPIYKPVTHVAAHSANIDSLAVKGQGPGMLVAAINNSPNIFWVASRLDPDGQPAGMIAIDPAKVGTVS